MGKVTDLLEREPYLILDGAMGTLLMKAGLSSGEAPEEWNLSNPLRVQEVHSDYLRAGARVILTNSFGGNPSRLSRHGLEARTFELNQAAGQRARKACEEIETGVVRLVAGSMGPTGEMMEPLGTLNPDRARAGFSTQAEGLASGGVDLLWIETMSDLQEVEAAVLGARDACGLPLAVTMTFDAGGRTMMGTTPAQVLECLGTMGLLAVGANCGNGPEEIEPVLEAMAAVSPGTPLISKANAGKPAWVNGELVYDGTPSMMAEHARRLRALGVQLIGGCCGTTPDHIRAMAENLREPT
jgi:5-methyltetrahydrofolate--homocysteine methyltransferase